MFTLLNEMPLPRSALKTELLFKRFSFTNHGFPNDVTFDNEGTFYISDGPKKTIHRFKNGQMEAWMVDDETEQNKWHFIR